MTSTTNPDQSRDSTTIRTYRVCLAFCSEDAHLEDAERLGLVVGPCLEEYPVAVTFTLDSDDVDPLLDLLDEVIWDGVTAKDALEWIQREFPTTTGVDIAREVDQEVVAIRDYEVTGLGFPYRAYDHDFGADACNTRTVEAH